MRQVTFVFGALCLGFGIAAIVSAGGDDEEKKAKHTIKQVMKEAHKDKLLNKVVEGDASKEEKDNLLDLYISLLENKPKKGDEDSWHIKAGTLVVAAAKVSVGRDGAEMELKKAADCGACHKMHK